MRRAALCFLLLASCQSNDKRSVRNDWTTKLSLAERATIADLDGDGDREIVLADAKSLWVIDASGRELARSPVTGGIQVLTAADIDGNGHAEIFAGWGRRASGVMPRRGSRSTA